LLFSFCPWKLFGYSLSNFSIDPYLAANLLATMVLHSLTFTFNDDYVVCALGFWAILGVVEQQ